MPLYCVTIQGRGLLMRDVDTGEPLRLGFFASRFVRERSATEAQRRAAQLVRNEFRRQPKECTRALVLTASETDDGGWWTAFRRRASGRGYAFYPDQA